MQAIDLEDMIVRHNDKYLRMVYLRLGKALHWHSRIAKEHAASMKEAAFTWQQRAIKLIESATNGVQIDNKKNLKEIRNEAQKVNKDLRNQLAELNKKYNDLQTEHKFTCAALSMKEGIKEVQESDANVSKITQLTLELGEQRKSNEELRKQLQELLTNFTSYRAGHIKSSIENDIKDKRDSISTRNNAGSDRISTSPNWGKTRKTNAPYSSEWDSKGESSTSQSDHGWGNPPIPRRKDRRRTPPRDDWKYERQRSPPVSRHSDRDVNAKKKAASPSKEVQPAKKVGAREAWMSGGKAAILQWTGVEPFRKTIRSLGKSDTKNMITRVKEAESDIRDVFYQFHIPYDERVNEAHLKYLPLQKELGIPGISDKEERTVSLNFYYAKILHICYEHQSRIRMKEDTDNAIMDIYEPCLLYTSPSPRDRTRSRMPSSA